MGSTSCKDWMLPVKLGQEICFVMIVQNVSLAPHSKKGTQILVSLCAARLISIVPSTLQQFMEFDFVCPISVYTLQS